MIMRFKQFIRRLGAPTLASIMVSEDDQTFQLLEEGKWYKGRFDKSVRVDNPTHGVGERHAHLYGRKGEKIGVINVSGTGSHGWTHVRVPDDDADLLRGLGFTIPDDNIVEWMALENQPDLLLG